MKWYSVLLFLLMATIKSGAQNPENWTTEQLLQPAQLAQQLEAATNKPVVICVGPGAVIPGSVDAGPAKEKESLAKLATVLKGLNRDTSVVVYCGCCPFEHCPNVRPAIALLKDLHFTHYRLLNLPHNIKTDWIDKGYPAAKL